MGWLEYIINTPSSHRLHHGKTKGKRRREDQRRKEFSLHFYALPIVFFQDEIDTASTRITAAL